MQTSLASICEGGFSKFLYLLHLDCTPFFVVVKESFVENPQKIVMMSMNLAEKGEVASGCYDVKNGLSLRKRE
jgi:hypothetical protein